MTGAPSKGGFASRPTGAEAWIRTPDTAATSAPTSSNFTARLTIDVTPELRGRIKIAAFRKGQTVADMLRSLLAETFPAGDGEAP